MRIDEDAPTTEWPRLERVHMETPLGGVELSALQSSSSAAWDAQTFAVRLPVQHQGPSRLLAMSIAALLSFVIGLATFLLVMRLQTQSRVDAQVSTPAVQSLGAAPLVEEGIPIPAPAFDNGAAPSSLDIRFVPTGDVLAPPAPSLPAELPLPSASLIVPSTSAAPAPRPPHGSPAPTVRKGKKQH